MKFFKREEFACQCGCGFDTVDYELAEVLDDVRLYFREPVTITSGCRCASHNRSIGGAENSQHVMGRASDIKVKDTEPRLVYNYLNSKYPEKYGIGLYSGWVHIDTRNNKARWGNKES